MGVTHALEQRKMEGSTSSIRTSPTGLEDEVFGRHRQGWRDIVHEVFGRHQKRRKLMEDCTFARGRSVAREVIIPPSSQGEEINADLTTRKICVHL